MVIFLSILALCRALEVVACVYEGWHTPTIFLPVSETHSIVVAIDLSQVAYLSIQV